MDINNATYVSFNGLTLNDSDYWTGMPIEAPVQGTGELIEIQRGESAPVYTGKVFGGRTIPLNIHIKTNGSGSIGEILEYFDPYDADEYQLIVKDTADSDKQWYVNATVHTATPISKEGPLVSVVLYAADPVWRTVTPLQTNWSVTSDGDTEVINVGGNKAVRVTFDVTPTTARGSGYGYRRFVAVENNAPNKIGYLDALDITDGGWDTATLVSGGKMQADGDDLRVIDDLTGQELMRFFGGGGINNASTQVWVNTRLRGTWSVTLGASIASSGAVDTITVEDTLEGEQFLRALDSNPYKVVVIDFGGVDEEYFTYTGVNLRAKTITGCTRAQKDSSMAAHTTSDTVQTFNGYWILYGHSTAEAPTVDTDFQPIFDLANSTNASRVYTDYYDPDTPNRLGQWLPKVVYNQGGESEFYTANHLTEASGVAEELGIVLRPYTVSGIDRSAVGRLCWYFTHPVLIESVAVSGEKRRETTSWPAVAGLRYMASASAFTALHKSTYEVWNETTPGSASTWTAFSQNATAGAVSDVPGVALMLGGLISADDTYAAIEFDSITVALTAANVPDITFGSEVVNNHADFRITNNTTGEWIEVHAPLAVNDSIIVDTEDYECYRESDAADLPILLDDESRAEWLLLQPGNNTLQYDEANVVAVTVLVTWEDLSL